MRNDRYMGHGAAAIDPILGGQHAPAAIVSGGGFKTLVQAVLWVAERVHGYFRRRRQYAELMALDDRMLSDIGITRGDIPNIVAGRHLEQPSNLRFVAVETRKPLAA